MAVRGSRTENVLREALLGIGLLVGVAAFASGCGTPDVDGTPLQRGGGAADDSSGDGEEGEDVLPEQGGGSLGPAAVAPALPCAGSELALCLTFEDSTSDASPAQLQPAMAAGIGFVAGKEGKGGAFQPGSALRYAPSPALDLPADATIEAWIARTPTGADAVVFDDDERFSLTIDAAGHVWCKSSGGAVVGASVLPVGQWVHVACVTDQGTMRAYVNGVVDKIGTGSVGKAITPTAAAAVGGNSPSGEEFSGTIDVLRVFKVARTPEQIAAAAKGM
jgi:hypothetical protein